MNAAPTPVDLMLAAVDEHGLLPGCCSVARSDGFIAGFVEGHAEGRESVHAGIEADVAQVVGNAVKSIDVQVARAKPYEAPGWAR